MLFKVNVSRAFRHIRIDSEDIDLLYNMMTPTLTPLCRSVFIMGSFNIVQTP